MSNDLMKMYKPLDKSVSNTKLHNITPIATAIKTEPTIITNTNRGNSYSICNSILSTALNKSNVTKIVSVSAIKPNPQITLVSSIKNSTIPSIAHSKHTQVDESNNNHKIISQALKFGSKSISANVPTASLPIITPIASIAHQNIQFASESSKPVSKNYDSSETASTAILNYVLKNKLPTQPKHSFDQHTSKPIQLKHKPELQPANISSSISLISQTTDQEKTANKNKKEKCSKGLRHFSMKVCEKVKNKGTTTYSEVADELVNEYCTPGASNPSTHGNHTDPYDQKNVRRRVYDALNVLMAMNIISKEKKEIKWIGLPCNRKQEAQDLEATKKQKLEDIQHKCQKLKDLIVEQIATKTLIERNIANQAMNASNRCNQDADSSSSSHVQKQIKLPFVLINTDNKTTIDCSISNDKKEYSMQLDNTFQIYSHLDVLGKLGLTYGLNNSISSSTGQLNSTPNEETLKKISSMLPKIFEPYIKQLSTTDMLQPVCADTDLPNYSKIINAESSQKLSNFLKIKSFKNISGSKSNTYKRNSSSCISNNRRIKRAKVDSSKYDEEFNDNSDLSENIIDTTKSKSVYRSIKSKLSPTSTSVGSSSIRSGLGTTSSLTMNTSDEKYYEERDDTDEASAYETTNNSNDYDDQLNEFDQENDLEDEDFENYDDEYYVYDDEQDNQNENYNDEDEDFDEDDQLNYS